MALNEYTNECDLNLFNSAGLIRLCKVKKEIDLDKPEDTEFVVNLYKNWVAEDEYMGFENKKTGEWIFLKCSKRGNDIYQNRVEESLKGVLKLLHAKINISNVNDNEKDRNLKSTNGLEIVLTYDTKLKSKSRAWLDVGNECNRFLSNLRKQYGKIAKVRSWESFENGYPHVHMAVIFKDKKFLIKQHVAKKGKNKGKITWRLRYYEQKEKIAKYWHSDVDIQGITDLEDSIKNVLWYILKNNDVNYKDMESWGRKELLTMASMWYFRKKSYSVSGEFTDLIQTVCSFQTQRILQLDLMGEVIEKFIDEWEFKGIIPRKKAEIESAEWCKLFKVKPGWADALVMPIVSLKRGGGITHDWFNS